MATMAEIMANLNTGLGNLSSTPMGQFGTQMLAQSGPQQGNPGGGARLGQALAGMSEQQRVQALQNYRNQQIQLAEQQQAMALRQAQAKAEQQQRQQQAMQDPNFLASLTPMARQMAQLGVDPGELIRAQNADNLASHRAATLAQSQGQFDMRQAAVGGGGGGGGQPSGPKQPAPRPYMDEPLGGDMYQRHRYQADEQRYVPWGKPFSKHAPGKAATGAEAVVDEVAPDPQADLSQLPGQGPLSSYAPQAAAPAPLLVGSGSNPMARKPDAAKGPATPKTRAEYDALPAGTSYVDPTSGKVAVKRGA